MTSSVEAPETGGAAHAVFLSYAREDRKQALQLVKLLGAAGHSTWWDGMLEPGERYSHVTEAALENASAVVVLWSRHSLGSFWVHDEAGRGRDRQCLVPVSLDGSEPPLGFRQFQAINAARGGLKPGSPAAEQVLRAVGALVERGDAVSLPAARTVRLTRRAALASAGTVAIVGAGALLWKGGILGGLPDSGSVAVMPFANLSGDPAQDYFSDGLSEELRSTLSLNRRLTVAAKTSSNVFRGAEVPATEIAQRLNVAHILDGSVRRSGDTVRITAQLIDGSDGFEKWSRNFDRELADIFEVQTEISYLVADALVKQIAGAGPAMDRVGGTSVAEAYDIFLQARGAYQTAEDEDDDRRALALFDRAIELDPDYAAAHAARARSLTFIANNYLRGEELAEYYDSSIAAARRAIAIAPDLAEAQAALGFTLFRGRLDATGASEPYERSYVLGFGNADILYGYASFAGWSGEFAKARRASDRAIELDPLNAEVFRSAAVIEYGARDYGAALRGAERALALNPAIVGTHYILGDVHFLDGDLEAARASYEREPDGYNDRLRGLAMIAYRLGERKAGDAALADMIDRYGENSLYQQAQIRAQRNEIEPALSLLERAYQAGDAGIVQSRNDPLLDPLRKQPRFAQLLQKIGFALPLGD
jgi:TolB-like protein